MPPHRTLPLVPDHHAERVERRLGDVRQGEQYPERTERERERAAPLPWTLAQR